MVSAALDELPDWASDLLETARVGHLGVLDDEGGPRVLPVTFALHDGAVWTAVDDKPKRRHGHDLARVRFVRRRPRAAITVDRYDDDWARLAWVQLLGDAEVVEVAQAAEALAALEARYDQYSRSRPAGPLLRLVPERVLCWRANERLDGRAALSGPGPGGPGCPD